MAKPATVRFYFDADVLGLAKVLARLRSDITYPGDTGGMIHKRSRLACIIRDPATPDSVWIRRVTLEGWLIVTRDNRIQQRTAEIDTVRSNAGRMVALAGSQARTTWDQLEVFMSQWRRIESCLDETGPFIYSVTRTAFRPVDLSA